MARQTIYTVGGTVQAGGGVYIKRQADNELLELCRQGEFAFILSSRQVGKSSLMVHTAQELAADHICSVIIDLSALGTSITQDEWYLGILNEIHSNLNLETNIFRWWQQYSQLGPAQRLANFFKDVLLTEVKDQVVLFFDEIDSTLSIPFSDDFYVALRAVYNARSTTPDFKRLSFVLVGVAAPSDLISDNRRTPFNIGRRVEIRDFSLAEALPLAQGLGQQAERVLAWVLQYTGGHPYLTQRLCAYLAGSKGTLNEQAVANAVEQLFTSEQGKKQDNNLQFVRDMLAKRSPDVARVMLIYRDIRAGKKVVDDERSITKAHLKLSGLVRSEQGFLLVRNKIYNTVFDLHWVQENTPKNRQKVAVISLSAILGILILAILAVFINDFLVGIRVNRSLADFISTTYPAQRLSDLANIYSQKGILSNTDSSLQATQLFYSLSGNEQRSMFTDYQTTQRARASDLVIVVSHLYVTLADVNLNKDNTDLLNTMRDALQKVTNDQNASSLQGEISFWLDGRVKARNEDYVNALSDYTNALNLNPSNQATLYERAKVFVGLQQYTDALKDLDSAVAAAKESEPKTSVISATASPLAATATSNAEEMQTRIPGSTLLPSTAVPSSVSGILALTPILTLTPASNLPSLNDSGLGSYESNFTNLIDVVNAVQVLIQSTPGLQTAAFQNGGRVYVNLESYGLLRELTFVTTESATPQDTSVPTQSSLVLTDAPTEIIPSVSSTQTLPIAAQAVNSVDGATFIHVPAGTFTMGLTDEQMNLLRQLCSAQDCEELYQVSQPAHTVELTSGYWIDRTEVSNTQYAKCVDSGNCSPPRSNSSGTRSTYYGNPDFADYPVVWVDWDRANAYCHWAGGRLPTSAEWEKAASWDEANQEKYLYPWGNTFDGTLLNFCDKNCLSSQWADPNVDDGNTDTAPVESYDGGASPYGVLNMAGNVWEWVSDWFNVSYYKDNINWINPQGPTTGTVRVGRGGSFVIRNALTSVVIQDWEDPNNALPDYNYDGVGFRCVIPEQ